MLKAFVAGAAGAALMYFLDPNKGSRRWAATRQRVTTLLNPAARSEPTSHRLRRRAPDVAPSVHVVARRPMGTASDGNAARRDAALAARVEAELLGDPDVPPGQVTIRAERGRVVLRGRVDHPEQIGAIVDRVRAISGVTDVENRLHVAQSNARQD